MTPTADRLTPIPLAYPTPNLTSTSTSTSGEQSIFNKSSQVKSTHPRPTSPVIHTYLGNKGNVTPASQRSARPVSQPNSRRFINLPGPSLPGGRVPLIPCTPLDKYRNSWLGYETQPVLGSLTLRTATSHHSPRRHRQFVCLTHTPFSGEWWWWVPAPVFRFSTPSHRPGSRDCLSPL